MIIISVVALLCLQLIGDFYKPLTKFWNSNTNLNSQIILESKWKSALIHGKTIEISLENQRQKLSVFNAYGSKTLTLSIDDTVKNQYSYSVYGITVYDYETQINLGQPEFSLNSSNSKKLVIYWIDNRRKVVSELTIPENIRLRVSENE